MNDSKNSSNGLLVLKVPQVLGKDVVQLLTDHITPIADQLGLEPMVLDGGADIRIEKGTDALLERVCVALEALVAQGQPPELSEPQIAPQALNARPTGLNVRPAPMPTYDGTNGNGYQPHPLPPVRTPAKPPSER
ncbi:hypothetical protein D3C76_469150 [compost metagenome]